MGPNTGRTRRIAFRLCLHAGAVSAWLAIGVAAPEQVAAWQGSPRRVSGPIFATEDSLKQYVLPDTTRVRSTRVPLLEILRKAQEGERHKFDGIRTMAYNRTVKVTMEFGGRKPRTECHETATRVYYREPDQWAAADIHAAHFEIDAEGKRTEIDPDADEDHGGVRVEVGDGHQAARSLQELPDYLERLDKYDFQILERHIRSDQVLYVIGFEPKSDFEILPSGKLWLLTKGYQLVREEMEFKRLPMPGLLKDVDLVAREWQEIDGHWVEKRISARVKLGFVPLPGAPKTVEVVLVYDHYRFDLPLEDALFESDPK